MKFVEKNPSVFLQQDLVTSPSGVLARNYGRDVSFGAIFVHVNKTKLECAVDGAPSQIPTLMFLTHPAPPSPTPGAWPQQQNENSQGPRGGQKKFDVACPIHMSSSHTKFGWISSNGIGGDSITDRQAAEAITISPSLF